MTKTRSTMRSASSNAQRSSSYWMGRSGPFQRRTRSSSFTPTAGEPPSRFEEAQVADVEQLELARHHHEFISTGSMFCLRRFLSQAPSSGLRVPSTPRIVRQVNRTRLHYARPAQRRPARLHYGRREVLTRMNPLDG
jgi:hypothetical protein